MTAAGRVAAGAVLGGTTLSVRDSTSTVAGDPPIDERAASDTTNPLLDGASGPADLDPAPLEPLATLLAEDRVEAVTGVVREDACAWVSRYAADEVGPAGREVEILTLSEEWVMLQAIAGDDDDPSRVSTIAADLRRDDLMGDWRLYPRCKDFPADTDLE